MNSLERIIAAIERKPLDKVPHFEWITDKKVMDALMPKSTFEEFCTTYTDAVCVDINYDITDLQNGMYKDEWGMIKTYTEESHSFPIDGAIHNMEELSAFIPPNPTKPGRFKKLKETLKKYGDNKAVILHMNDVWSLPSRMMTFDNFMFKIIDEPEFIKALVKMTVDAQIALAQEARKTGVKFLYTGDDVAYNSGPIISPTTFDEIFMPELRRIIGAYKDMGFYVLKHSDGNIMPLLSRYLDVGFDVLDPIDPIAGMDLKYMKDSYGDSITLKGNVNCATTLTYGTVDDVVEETKYCLSVAKGKTGYICSSSNSIHSSVKPENYKAMLETIEEFGRY